MQTKPVNRDVVRNRRSIYLFFCFPLLHIWRKHLGVCGRKHKKFRINITRWMGRVFLLFRGRLLLNEFQGCYAQLWWTLATNIYTSPHSGFDFNCLAVCLNKSDASILLNRYQDTEFKKNILYCRIRRKKNILLI